MDPRRPVWFAILLAAASVCALLLFPIRASAFFGPVGCDCATVSRLHSGTRSHVTRQTRDAANTVVEGIRKHSGQNSRYLDRQVEAMKRIADGQEQNATMRIRDIVRAEAESGRFDPNPDYCLLFDASEANSNSRKDANPGLQAAVEASTWASGDRDVIRTHGTKLAAWLARERRELAGSGGSDDATTDWGMVFDRPTADLDDPDVKASIARLVANTVEPEPRRPLTDAELETPGGLAESLKRQATSARNNAAIAALKSVLSIAAPRIPSEHFNTIAARSHYGKPIPDLISELQQLDIRTTSYFAPKPAALDQRQAKTERALLQDVIDIMSLNARIGYRRLELENRNTVVLAAILGMMTDGSTSNLLPE
ncbi:MAG: hypothetical protein OXI87_11480 [Albidovulum sp.]|nr:hypothetical protein [Albidovulum sp.]